MDTEVGGRAQQGLEYDPRHPGEKVWGGHARHNDGSEARGLQVGRGAPRRVSTHPTPRASGGAYSRI